MTLNSNYVLNNFDTHCYGIYSIGEWNLGGFYSLRNPYYLEFKKQIIATLCVDILVLPEIHCLPEESVIIDNFTTFQNNRLPISRANRGSGGIAIALHNKLLDTHDVISVIKGVDGQLALILKNSLTDFTVGILALYLPPDSYHYGKDPETFFNEAAVLYEDLSECDLVVGSGDLNSRTKEIIE